MGFLLSGLWHLASLLDWTSVVSPALGVLARWYAGPLSGLTRLLARAWDGYTAAAAPPRETADRSVVVMLTQHVGGRIAVRSAYLLFYGVTGAVVLAVKLVAEGACLGYCLARAGLAHLTGGADSPDSSTSSLAESQLMPPPAVRSSLSAADSSAADSLAGADVSLLLSSAFCRVPDAVPPADLAGTEFVCVALDDRDGGGGDAAAAAEAATTQFEQSLQAELPQDTPLVAVAADRARAFVCAAPSAPSAVPSATPTPTLHEFIAECRAQPLPAPPPSLPEQEEDVDLVTVMCPSLASSQVVPGTSNNSLLSGWVMLKRDQQ